MLNFMMKTHKPGTQYTQPHFFVLNKGMNSGKPQKESFTNSFVIVFKCENEADNCYWIAFSLWKSKFWHQHLIGSVIPFLCLTDFKKQFNAKATQLMHEHDEHVKNIEALKRLEQQENRFKENINLINDLRKVILYRYCNK